MWNHCANSQNQSKWSVKVRKTSSESPIVPHSVVCALWLCIKVKWFFSASVPVFGEYSQAPVCCAINESFLYSCAYWHSARQEPSTKPILATIWPFLWPRRPSRSGPSELMALSFRELSDLLSHCQHCLGFKWQYWISSSLILKIVFILRIKNILLLRVWE